MFTNPSSSPSSVSHEQVHATASEQLESPLSVPFYKTRQALSLRLRRLSHWLSQDSKLMRKAMGIGLSRRDALDLCMSSIMASCAIIMGDIVHGSLYRAALALSIIPAVRISWRATGRMLHALQEAEYDADLGRETVAHSIQPTAVASRKRTARTVRATNVASRKGAATPLSSHLSHANTSRHA